jgi:hypothetical protein
MRIEKISPGTFNILQKEDTYHTPLPEELIEALYYDSTRNGCGYVILVLRDDGYHQPIPVKTIYDKSKGKIGFHISDSGCIIAHVDMDEDGLEVDDADIERNRQ